MNEKLLKKLMNEESLDAAEHLALEQALEAGDESLVAKYFSAQDHVEPSLAWRSGLNDQLRQIAPKPQRRLNWFALGGLVSAGAVACAAMVLFMDQSGKVSPDVKSIDSVVIGQGEKLVDAPPRDSELGYVLVTSHQSDTAQVSLGVRSPRVSSRAVSNRLDYENW
ncbi:MAG: hypothetical protein ACKVQS_07415 [Fimbriimonadaceae bacterium]